MVRKSHVVYYPSPFSQGFFLLCFFVFSQHGPFSASCILLLIYRRVYIEIKFFFITLSFMCYKHQVWILNHTPHDYNTQDIPPSPPPLAWGGGVEISRKVFAGGGVRIIYFDGGRVILLGGVILK